MVEDNWMILHSLYFLLKNQNKSTCTYIYYFAGLYKKDSKHTECHKCVSGYYNNVFCSTECEICPEGYYCPVSVLGFVTEKSFIIHCK